MPKYDHKKIEKKWKKVWEKSGIYETKNTSDRPKYYILDMFPYPSGAGLHVGHPKGYIATDIIARMKMMQGYNVLHPMGWDAFGLPAENYALEHHVHPREATEKNIKTFKKQLGLLGFTYDWDREVNTTDPEYYKWTQWIFLQLFKKGLAYESYEPINWCPTCQTGLANEDLEDGKCERCGTVVEKKPMRQWVLKITKYADRLLNDLDKLEKWPEPIKEMQRNWIGRSEGAEIDFQIKDSEGIIRVFTTRPDTLFGATYMVVAPEHRILEQMEGKIENWQEVQKYITEAKKKSDLERTDLTKEKTGVELNGIKVINPATNEELPIFVADYVITGYGTGAIMAVPAHDERDWEFAKKYNLKVRPIMLPRGGSTAPCNTSEEIKQEEVDKILNEGAFEGDGYYFNSGFLSSQVGYGIVKGKEKIIAWLEEKGIGQRKVQYKLRDWVFSRQRYWGEPIPLIHCEKCGVVAVPENELPVELPKVKNYEPTGTGESPLAGIHKWVNTKCPVCGGKAKRETNTMPQWAGSCWYYLRYIDPKNNKALVDKEKEKYWSPVDLYVGGAEHATRHLIYARFWHKFLYDIGAVNYDEPFTRLQNVGLILAEDGRKMSKRWGNVINPDEVVEKFGADAMRVYEMFMGPFDQPCAWSMQGLVGAKRFLEKVWVLREKTTVIARSEATRQSPEGEEIASASPMARPRNDKLVTILHQTIKKVSDDIENMHFNTAIAKLMELTNEMGKEEDLPEEYLAILVKLLAPFAPHLSEDIWITLGHKDSIFSELWPKFDAELAKDSEITLAVQINGKLRDTLVVPADITEDAAKKLALESEKARKWLAGQTPKKVIYIKGKLVSIVV